MRARGGGEYEMLSYHCKLERCFLRYDTRSMSCAHCGLSLTLDDRVNNLNKQTELPFRNSTADILAVIMPRVAGSCPEQMTNERHEAQAAMTRHGRPRGSCRTHPGTHLMTTASGSSRSARSGQLSVRGTCYGSHTWGGRKQSSSREQLVGPMQKGDDLSRCPLPKAKSTHLAQGLLVEIILQFFHSRKNDALIVYLKVIKSCT